MTGPSQAGMFEERSRGRPKHMSILYKAPLKTIVLIAKKHDLKPELLVEAFAEAWKKTISRCGSLTIRCRLRNRDAAIFLVTKGGEAVSQFPIKLEALEDLTSLKGYLRYIPISNTAKKVGQRQRKISELKNGMRGVDIKAKIVGIPPAKLVFTRFGSQSYVSNVEIADETGSIRVSLWNNRINRIHVGDIVEIKNCYVSSFAGELQLRIGRKGVLTVIKSERKEAAKSP